ncbi:MAG: ABC transporter substrate-binding protein [Bacilli bacterium]|nr:ABC transporter substrate-binding protein [Bacilli bacterium]
MKKIFYTFLVILLLVLCLIFFLPKKEKNDNMNSIKIAEVTHSVFYAPLYVAIEESYFRNENIDIKLILTPGADKVSAAVLSGDVQIGFAGAESAIYVYEKNEKDYLQIFSGLTKRDGQFILGRKDKKDFSLKDLYGKEILVGRSSGMPALNFLNALKNEEIDKNKIKINYNIDFASLSGAFIGNTGDYVNLFEPTALKLEKEGYGYVLQSIGLLSGEMPYTTFYARKSYIENNKEIIKSFTKAINKGLEFVKNNDEMKIAKSIYKQFPDLSLNDLSTIVKRYKDADSFLDSSYIEEKLLVNLENLLIDNNLLKDYVPYNDLIIEVK